MPDLSPTERAVNKLTRIREQFLQALERNEGQALQVMITQYAGVVKQLRIQLEQDWQRIEARRAAGEEPRRSWIYEEGRLQRLLEQAEWQFKGWSTLAAQLTEGLQSAAVNVAGDHVVEELRYLLTPPGAGAVVIGFDVLPAAAHAQLVGTLQDGSPLTKLFNEIGPQVREQMSEALVLGIMKGDSPRDVGRRMAQSTGVGLVRGIRIARTEMMRSYRTAHHDNYRANSNVLAGWVWLSSRNSRTCPACLAMHGTFHPLSEELLDHPNGRCTPMPVTKTWAQMGLGNEARANRWGDSAIDPDALETGEAWFASQPPAVKIDVLGHAGAAAYQAGMVKLADFVTVRRSRVWGNSISTRSLVDAIAHARSA